MTAADADSVLGMMRVFYASDAVLSNGSEEIFSSDLAECVSDSPYAEGFILLLDGETAGYAMLAKSFSTEFGRRCVWIEDLYVRAVFRGQGIGSAFLQYAREKYPEAVLRLEAEKSNARAVRTYEKCGFEELPYLEMIRR